MSVMITLETDYLGLKLRNPLIVSSCSLTSTLPKLKSLEEHGAGAVVLKSIFEEQIMGETAMLERYSDYPEASDYLHNYLSDDYLRTHLELISKAKAELTIPVIASINCAHAGEWVDYARRMEKAGADAIELNIFMLPLDMTRSSDEIEQAYLEIVNKVVAAVSIPVSVKLGIRFTNILSIAQQIYYRRGKGVVMYNRFFEPDIDVDNISVVSSDPMSTSAELRNSLRTVALCSSQLPMLDIAVSTGVHSGEDAVKALLVGAKGVQICSTLYTNGLEVIRSMSDYIESWMERHTFSKIEDFRGMLSYKGTADTEDFQRVQYMKFFPKDR